MEDKIKELKLKRFKLRDKLSLWDKHNKDYNKGLTLAYEYASIIEQLKQLGFKPESKVNYVNIEYWEDKISGNIKTQPEFTYNPTTPIQQNFDLENVIKTTLKEACGDLIKPKIDVYILTLAWTNKSNETLDLSYLFDFFKEFEIKCMQPIDSNQILMNNEEEFMIKYEFVGNEYEYNTLKKSIQYIIDNIYSTIDIGFFGKKRSY